MAQQKWNLGDIRAPSRGTSESTTRSKSRRQIQEGGTPVRVKEARKAESAAPDVDTTEQAPRRSPKWKKTGGGKKKTFFRVFIVLILLAISFCATLFWQGAELTIYPKYKNVTVQAAFTAYQNPAADAIGYELLSLEETGERSVTATGQEEVEEQATGEIVVFNAFSKESQRLIKNTRFESGDGKIFRISDSIVIPGYTTNGAGEKVPGTVTAKAFADVAGEEYNIAPGRFTVPGLKGTPQFDGIYGQSASGMQGGFIGSKLIVGETELNQTKETIQAELRTKLLTRLQSERPAGFELYESAARVRFESLPSVDAGQNQATIRQRAILEVPLFAKADFARYLAQNTIVGYEGEKVLIENPESLTFAYVTASSTESSTDAGSSIEFNLSGNIKIVWDYDKNQLREDVSGATKKELPSILLKYQPAIERATSVMRPFWRQSFPSNPAKIKIIEVFDSPE